MLALGRPTPLRYLKWTKASYVRESIEHVMDTGDRFFTEVRNYGSLINELRIVRNHVAHRTA